MTWHPGVCRRRRRLLPCLLPLSAPAASVSAPVCRRLLPLSAPAAAPEGVLSLSASPAPPQAVNRPPGPPSSRGGPPSVSLPAEDSSEEEGEEGAAAGGGGYRGPAGVNSPIPNDSVLTGFDARGAATAARQAQQQQQQGGGGEPGRLYVYIERFNVVPGRSKARRRQLEALPTAACLCPCPCPCRCLCLCLASKGGEGGAFCGRVLS